VTNGTESGTQQQTATITDDDAAPTVTLSMVGASMAEAAGSATVTATLSAASSQNVTVSLGFTGTATLTSDYTRSGTSITINAGSTTGSITLTAVQDTLDEANETIVVDIASVTNGTESGTQQQTATITDDDAAPTVTLSLTGSPMPEAAGVATVRASLSVASGQTVTVNLGFTGTATLTSDYTRSGTSIAIAAGSTSGTATLTAVNDGVVEANETIVVDISSVTNGTESGTQQVTATITDDDVAPNDPPVITSISFLPTAPRVGTTVTFTVAASDPESDPLTITYDYNDGVTDGSGIHAWAVAGTYTVTVSVSDAQHPAVTSTVQVVVAPSDNDGGGGGGGTPPPPPPGPVTPGADSDGDGVSDENELVDTTNPLDPKSLVKMPMAVLKMTGKVNFTTSGADGCSFSGILPSLPAKTNFASTLLKVDAGGATEVFSLSDKGKGVTPNGSVQLKLKFTTNRLTRIKEFVGGPVPFKITLKFGTWSDDWADEGISPAATVIGQPASMNVDITFNGRVYTASVNTLFSAKANLMGKFKN